MTATEELILERRGSALWAIINREDRRNALNAAVFSGFTRSLEMAEEDQSIRSIVWTSVGEKAFCSGGDLKPEKGIFDFDPAEPTTIPVNLMRATTACRVPIIGRINGHCLAGGLGVLAMCDIAVGVTGARFGLPEVRIGLFPMQIYPMLQQIVPKRFLAELCLTGQPISAERAAEIGLLNAVVPYADLDARIEHLVKSIEEASPTAIRRGKYAVNAMKDMTLEQALAFSEGQIAVSAKTQDAAEGKRAFNEKRAPVWTHR